MLQGGLRRLGRNQGAAVARAKSQRQVVEPSPAGALSLDTVEQLFAHHTGGALLLHEGRVGWCNARACALFGVEAEALRGQRFVEAYLHTDTLDDARGLVICHRSDGSHFTGELSIAPVAGAEGWVLVQVRDVSTHYSAETTLNRLHRITSDRSLSFSERLDAILQLGCDHFGMLFGILSRVQGQHYTVIQVRSPGDSIQPGTAFELGSTYCVHTLSANGPTGFHHAGASDIRSHPCYLQFELESYFGVPVVVDGEPFGTLNFSNVDARRPFSSQDHELLTLFGDWVGHELERDLHLQELERVREELRQAALTDALTGLRNRRWMMEALEHELNRSRRNQGPMSVVLVDFDHFKTINDVHGHATGDAALCVFADVATRVVRDMDVVGRWGGEEFLVLAPDTDLDGACALAERLRQAVEDVDLPGEHLKLTVSLGVAQLGKGDDIDHLVDRADKALYGAKENGRNQVVAAPMPKDD